MVEGEVAQRVVSVSICQRVEPACRILAMPLLPLFQGDGLAGIAEIENVQDESGKAEALVQCANMPRKGL